MAEHTRITQFFAPLTEREPGAFFLGDDAAVITPPPGYQLVITTDSVIEGIHVLPGATPQQFAQKLVRRNLSDLAAMGAKPWRYTLNLHTPSGLADDWFAQFAATLEAEQTQFGMVLVGGDSTSGDGAHIHNTMTCFGLIDGAPLRRNGAQVGDDIYVSGTLGDAAYALSLLQQNLPIDTTLASRYHAPSPRLELGKMLRGIATSCIDISDGLLADVQQLCRASGCGATIKQSLLPLSLHLQNAVLDTAQINTFALSGGDDYELCFTALKTQREAIQTIAETLQLPLTRIGSIVDGNKVEVVDEHGSDITPVQKGYEHR
jgi:thiamine-monophosphate kinase